MKRNVSVVCVCFVTISSLVLELFQKCRVPLRVGHPVVTDIAEYRCALILGIKQAKKSVTWLDITKGIHAREQRCENHKSLSLSVWLIDRPTACLNVYHPHCVNAIRNNRRNRPQTRLYYKNPQNDMFRLHETAINRLHVL